MSVRIFKNVEHQNLFDKQGFIVLPFLNPQEIDELNKIFDQLHPNIESSGFFSGSYSSDFTYKKKASDEIVRNFNRSYEDLFIDYTPFGAAFLFKVPGANSELAAHQDWTIVDEKKYVALNCWIPLCDISLENGPLMILPGSHFKNLNVLRAPTLPFFFSGEDKMVVDELEPMLVKAGTAVILNQSVIHYSLPNLGNTVRKAITAGVKSKDAQMYFHYKDLTSNKYELEVFEQEDDFLLRFQNFFEDISQRPKNGRSIGFIPYQLPQLKGNELYHKIKEMKTSAGFQMKTNPKVSESENQTTPDRKENSFLKKLTSIFTN